MCNFSVLFGITRSLFQVVVLTYIPISKLLRVSECLYCSLFFLRLFICLFIFFGYTGSLLLCGLSLVAASEVYSLWHMSSHCSPFSCCGAQAQSTPLQWLLHSTWDILAPEIKPCIGRWILNQWITREDLHCIVFILAILINKKWCLVVLIVFFL